MNCYLANALRDARLPKEQNVFEGLYILESFYYVRNDSTFEKLVSLKPNLLIDSGAFTFMAGQKQAINWDRYVEEYAAFLNKHHIELFFELDIDSIVGLAEVERLRTKLEFLTNKRCIPVWHVSRGIDYWKKMCQEYNYVAIGGYVSKDVPRATFEKAFPQLISYAHSKGAKVHGLGYTNIEGLKKFKFDSVDSTSWLSGNRYGTIYHFTGSGMEQLKPKEGQKAKNMETVLHNFSEWVKFQKYLKDK